MRDDGGGEGVKNCPKFCEVGYGRLFDKTSTHKMNLETKKLLHTKKCAPKKNVDCQQNQKENKFFFDFSQMIFGVMWQLSGKRLTEAWPRPTLGSMCDRAMFSFHLLRLSTKMHISKIKCTWYLRVGHMFWTFFLWTFSDGRISYKERSLAYKISNCLFFLIDHSS